MPQRREESCPECSIRVSFERVRGDSKEPARVRSKKARQVWESKGQVRQSERVGVESEIRKPEGGGAPSSVVFVWV